MRRRPPSFGRFVRVAGVALVLTGVIVQLPQRPAEAQTRKPIWVALGDSYSAGEGTVGPPERGDDTNLPRPAIVGDGAPPPTATFNRCHRSTAAYPNRLVPGDPIPTPVPTPTPGRPGSAASAADPTVSPRLQLPTFSFDLRHVACAGAVIADITGNNDADNPRFYPDVVRLQLSKPNAEGSLHGAAGQGARLCNSNDAQRCTDYTYQAPQITSVDTRAAVITLTVGGNDVLFDQVGFCLLRSANAAIRAVTANPFGDGKTCEDNLGDEVAARTARLTGRLSSLYRQLAQTAPAAKVLVLGYPSLVSTGSSTTGCTFPASGDIAWAIQVGKALNVAITDAVKASNNPRIQFAPMTAATAGNELCSTNPTAINGFYFGGLEATPNISFNDLYSFIAAGLDPNQTTQVLKLAKSFVDLWDWHPLFNNTLHPTAFGYDQMARVLAPYLQVILVSDQPLGADPTADPVDVVLIIDSSESMLWNDPQRKRVEAALSFLAGGIPGDQIGVVAFAGQARVLSNLAPLPAGKGRLISAIRSIDASGGTSIGSGVSQGCEILQRSTVPAAKKAAILLTDGESTFGNEDACFASRSWPIFTVGFGDSGETLLRRIATGTKGDFKFLQNVSDASCEFLRIRSRVAGTGAPPPCNSLVVKPKETKVVSQVIGPRQAAATFSMSWPGSDVVTSLVSPSGRRIDRGNVDPDVTHEVGSTYEVYSIRRPEPGEWSIELFGASVAASGERVVLSGTSLPISGSPPTAVASSSVAQGEAPLMVTFDGAGSRDADGALGGVSWDFGDGSFGSSDLRMTHVYAKAGVYQPRLVVTGSDGELGSTALPAIVVTGGVHTGETAGRAADGGAGSGSPLMLGSGIGLLVLGVVLCCSGVLRRGAGPQSETSIDVGRCVCGAALSRDMAFCDACGRASNPRERAP